MTRFALVALLALALPLFAAPVPKSVRKPLTLDGVWEVVELHSDGRAAEDHTARWTIDGEAVNYQTTSDGQSDATFALVPVKGDQANAFDYVVNYHTGRRSVYPGVVELDGDTLKLCYSTATTRDRPTECKSVKGTVMFVFKRKDAK